MKQTRLVEIGLHRGVMPAGSRGFQAPVASKRGHVAERRLPIARAHEASVAPRRVSLVIGPGLESAGYPQASLRDGARAFLVRSFALLLALLLLAPTSPAAQIVLVAGTPAAPLHEPFGAEPDGAGNLFIIEMAAGNRLLKLDAKGVLTHLAGTSVAGDSGDGGPALLAQFRGPHNLAVLPNGDILIADTWNGRIRRMDMKAGTVSTEPGYGVPAAAARQNGPYCIALNPPGSPMPAGAQLFIADLQSVLMVDRETYQSKPTEQLAVVPKRPAQLIAGGQAKGLPKDGSVAAESPLVDPRAVAVERHGNIYILERGGNALRVVDPTGHIRTVVNAEGKKGATGDGGPALAATLNGPKHICIDQDDGVLIADAENHLIRKYWPREGTLTRFAGTGKSGSAGVGGDPLQCELNRPHGVSVDRKTGAVFITDSYNNRVLKVVR